jgi:hypothetical protein
MIGELDEVIGLARHSRKYGDDLMLFRPRGDNIRDMLKSF